MQSMWFFVLFAFAIEVGTIDLCSLIIQEFALILEIRLFICSWRIEDLKWYQRRGKEENISLRVCESI